MTGLRFLIVDPSVLLNDPFAFERVSGSDIRIVLPRCSIEELGDKVSVPNLGSAARRALEWLDELRVKHGTLDQFVTLDNGVQFRIERNHAPNNRYGTSIIDRVLSVAEWQKKQLEGTEDKALVWAKDIVCRLRASAEGLEAADLSLDEVDVAAQMQWSGRTELEVPSEYLEAFFAGERLSAPEDLLENTAVVLHSGTSSALARVRHGELTAINTSKRGAHISKLRLNSAEQKFAWDLLNDESVGIVSLGGRAGAGKTALSLAAGISAVLSDKAPQERVVVLRSTHAVGGRGIGFLPGAAGDKMAPWTAAIKDAMQAFAGDDELYKKIVAKGQLEIAPLDFLRGRSFHDAFVIVDEAQNLESNVLLTALTRIGRNARIVLTHDVTQLDNLHVGKYDGITALVHELQGLPEFGHLTMVRSERSRIADIVSDRLQKFAF